MTDMPVDYRLPRIFVESGLNVGSRAALSESETHYLKNVMRRPDGSALRVFNARDGEFHAELHFDGKKSAFLYLTKLLRAFICPDHSLTLAFSPIRKDRMDFLIEKSVELGATRLQPLWCDHTNIRDLNIERLKKQIVEAAEQCERLDIPDLCPPLPLAQWIAHREPDHAVYAAIERAGLPHLSDFKPEADACFLVGPEGGFSENERDRLMNAKGFVPVSLGDRILRAETAALFGLSLIGTAQSAKTSA